MAMPTAPESALRQWAEQQLGRPLSASETELLRAYQADPDHAGSLPPADPPVGGDDESTTTKLAQSDVPDNLLSLLIALRASSGK